MSCLPDQDNVIQDQVYEKARHVDAAREHIYLLPKAITRIALAAMPAARLRPHGHHNGTVSHWMVLP